MTEADLSVIFEQQRDPDANRMAAFTVGDPSDREAFAAHWARVLGDAAVTKKVILCDGEIAGTIVSFEQAGRPAVGYWLGRAYWGKGIATAALRLLLEIVRTRPLHARVASDNAASRRVLEKCGFVRCGEDVGFSNVRGTEVKELIFVRAAP